MPIDESLPRREFLRCLSAASALSVSVPRMFAEPKTHGDPRSGAVDWSRVRGDFGFEAGLAYLNTAALGAVPRPILERVAQTSRLLETNPTAQGYFELERAMDEVRRKLANLVGCDLKEMIATNSTTDGMNIVAQGIGLTKGQRVLTTDQEHPGGSECWNYFARRYGVGIDRVKIPLQPKSAQEILEVFDSHFTPETRVVSVSHITTTTGTLMPIRQIADLAHANGALCVVDGAQAAGSVPMDVRALGCDAYASCGHKWLSGPTGTGLLYIAAEQRRAIDPIFLQGGENAYSGSTGVRNIPGIVGLGVSVDYLSALGQDKIWKHNMALREIAYEGLGKIRGVQMMSPASGPLASPLVAVSLPAGYDNHKFHIMLLDKYNIQVKVLPGDAVVPRGIRVSPHIFNDEEDVQRFLRAVSKEINSK